MLELGLKTLIAYLLGSLVGAAIVGATKLLRPQGHAFNALAILIDTGKGWLATALVPQLAIPSVTPDTAIDREWLAVSCAAAAGHVWPRFFGFHGGRGGATLVGALLAFAPVLAAVAIAAWIVVAALTGFAGLATIAAALTVPVAVGVLGPASGPLLAFTLVMAAFIVFTHSANIARMENGVEPRLDRIWLLRPRSRGR